MQNLHLLSTSSVFYHLILLYNAHKLLHLNLLALSQELFDFGEYHQESHPCLLSDVLIEGSAFSKQSHPHQHVLEHIT